MSLMSGGGGALEFLRKINELENRIEQLENKNESLFDVEYISEAPSGGKVKFFSAIGNISIGTGTIPNYSKGVYIPIKSNNGSDAIIIASNMDNPPKILAVIKNNGTWRVVREI